MPLRSLKYTPVDVRFNQLPSTESSLQTRNQYYMAAIQRQNKVRDDLVDSKATIAATLNALPVHESEQGWLDDYAYATEEKINNYIRQGDYDSALYAARTLAKTALTDPAVTSRVKRNAAFEAEKNRVLADKNLDAVTKQRWEEENDYTTGLSVDDKGRVNEWNAAWNPVKPINTAAFAKQAVDLVAERKGSGSSATFIDSTGKNITSINNATNKSVNSSSTTVWERKDYDDIKDNFIQLLRTTPGALEALDQDLANRRWEIEKSEERLASLDPNSQAYIDELAKLNALKDSVTSLNGAPLGAIDYALFNANAILKNLSYNNRMNSTTWHNKATNTGNGTDPDNTTIATESPDVVQGNGLPVVQNTESDYDKKYRETSSIAEQAAANAENAITR